LPAAGVRGGSVIGESDRRAETAARSAHDTRRTWRQRFITASVSPAEQAATLGAEDRWQGVIEELF